MKTILAILVFLSSQIAIAQGRVRKVAVTNDQIVTVQTAIGIATLIQLPERPNSVVLGDQDSFKVEYLDKAITVKPLHSQARSNLYLYTDWKRYNVQLVTGTQNAADYVVYLDNKREEPVSASPLRWKSFRGKITSTPFTLETKRATSTNDGSVLLEFNVSAIADQQFRPEWIWITQSGRVRPINQLFLSHGNAARDRPIHGVLQLLERDFDRREPIRLEVRRARTHFLTIPKAVVWK